METVSQPVLEVHGLELGYGDIPVLRDVSFKVRKGGIFIIMGASGSGKSTLLKALIGLNEPVKGEVLYAGKDFWAANTMEQQTIMRRFGVLYQGGALWSSLTLGENILLPLQLYSALSAAQMNEIALFKLSLVGLVDYADSYPSSLSGGMRKRAGLARALALDPDIVFFDEPSAGLDPINAHSLDDLILQLRDALGSTFVIVTHELASIFTLGDDSIFLDAETKTITAAGRPQELLDSSENPKVIEFLTRGKKR